LKALPFGNSQLACALVNGVAAVTGAAVLGVALAGFMRTDAPIPETMKRRLSAIARMDVLLNVFFILCINSFVISFVNTFVMRLRICPHHYLGLARSEDFRKFDACLSPEF